MLVNDEVEFFLPAAPCFCRQDGSAFATAADEVDAFKYFLAGRARKIVGKPINLMAGSRQLSIKKRMNSWAGQRRAIFSSREVVDLPGTKGTRMIFPPADSTARRSSWFSVSSV